jgi:hypothetical protein
MSDVKRQFTGVFIPANIWLSQELIPSEKMLLGEIDALSKESGWCYASRKHFCEWLQCSLPNVSYYVEKLERLGFLEVDRKPGERSKMRVVNSRFYEKRQVVNGTDGVVNGTDGVVNGTDGVVNGTDGVVNGTDPKYKYIDKNKNKKKEKLAPQAAFITTHTPTEFENVEVVIVEGQTITLEEKTNLEPITPAAGKKPRTPKPAGNNITAVCAEISDDRVLVFFHGISEAWGEWIDYKRRERKGTYKTAKTEAATIAALAKGVNYDPEAGRAAIEHSIAHTYSGIYPPKGIAPTAAPAARYSLEDRPVAKTPEEMKVELSQFYNAHKEESLFSQVQEFAGTNYGQDRVRSIVADFCGKRIEQGRQGETFAQHHAALGLWLKRQKEFDAAKSNPVQQQHTAGPQPQAPLRSAAPVNYSQQGPQLRSEQKAE